VDQSPAGPKPAGESTKAREHLANERTLLAWIRTAIALMGLGFVVARFGLFLREISATGGSQASATESVWSGPIGIALVAAGLVAVLVSTLRFFQARNQIEKGHFVPEAYPEVIVVAVTLAAGAALIAYLALSSQ
jgi:putative membrane protein